MQRLNFSSTLRGNCIWRVQHAFRHKHLSAGMRIRGPIGICHLVHQLLDFFVERQDSHLKTQMKNHPERQRQFMAVELQGDVKV